MSLLMQVKGAKNLIVLLPLYVGLTGCLSRPNEIVSQVSTTNYIATLSRRDIGTVRNGLTLVSLRASGVPDSDTHGLIILQVNGNQSIQMKWIGVHQLEVSCATCTQEDVSFEVVKSDNPVIKYDDNLLVR